MFGAYSSPGLSPPALQPANAMANDAPTVKLLITRIILLIFKVLFIDLLSTSLTKQPCQVVLTLPPVDGQVDSDHVLVVCAAHIELAGPFVGLHVTDYEKRCHHPEGGQQYGQLECHRNKRRKRSEVLSTDNHRPVVSEHPNLHHKCQRRSC